MNVETRLHFMKTSPLTGTALRLTAFAVIWVIVFIARLKLSDDPRIHFKVSLVAGFLLPATGALLILQSILRFRIIPMLEFLLLPFITCGLIYGTDLIRHFIYSNF